MMSPCAVTETAIYIKLAGGPSGEGVAVSGQGSSFSAGTGRALLLGRGRARATGR